MIHKEPHKSHRVGWLRAAVLGANDGIVSTASLIIGIASAESSHSAVMVAGVAGLVAGAMSMSAGEYVSVSSQADTERADLKIEQRSIENNYESEHAELSEIYQERGLNATLADQVAQQLMQHDALGAHARDEIGINEVLANPWQAAISSGFTFTIGAALPLTAAWLAPYHAIVTAVALCSLLCLASLGALAAHAGGAPKLPATIRVTLWSGLAMLVTAITGLTFGAIS